jgi:hypothetical protein
MHRDNFNDPENSSFAGGRPPEGNKNCMKNCLWEMSRKSQLGKCCRKRENAITKDFRKVVLKM